MVLFVGTPFLFVSMCPEVSWVVHVVSVLSCFGLNVVGAVISCKPQQFTPQSEGRCHFSSFFVVS